MDFCALLSRTSFTSRLFRSQRSFVFSPFNHHLTVAMDYTHKQSHFELNEAGHDSSPERENYGHEIKPGTATDSQDMHRMGKQQQLSRQFHALSIFALTTLVMFTWQAILSTAIFSLINGGRGGSVYSFLATWIFTIPVIASMAEMSSMAPTSGGQYRIVQSFPLASVYSADRIRLGLRVRGVDNFLDTADTTLRAFRMYGLPLTCDLSV